MSTDTANKESITLIWFDPNIGSREDTERTKQRLRLINDYVIFLTDLEQCIKLIENTKDERIFLITPGSKSSEILPRIHSCGQIDSIFIYCMKKERYEHLTSEFPKEKKVLFDLNVCFLIKPIEEDENVKIMTMSVSNEGQNITQYYIELTEKETEDKSVAIIFGKLLYSLGQYDKSQIYFE